MKIVVDTSILIDYLRGGTKWQDFLLEAPRDAELFLPTIVIFELFSGESTKNASIAKDILNIIKKLTGIELSENIARQAGELKRELGKQIAPQDYIIAASAQEIGGKVVTLNTKDFTQIPGIKIYPL